MEPRRKDRVMLDCNHPWEGKALSITSKYGRLLCGIIGRNYLINLLTPSFKHGLRNGFIHRYGIRHWVKYFIGYSSFLRSSHSWNQEEVQKYQMQKFRDLLAYAKKQVPYYSDLLKRNNLFVDDFKEIKDLEKFPVLTKEKLRENREKFISHDFKKKHKSNKWYLFSTSGTTGMPLSFYHDSKSLLTSAAHRSRRSRWMGHGRLERMVGLWAFPFSSIHSHDKYYYHSNDFDETCYWRKGDKDYQSALASYSGASLSLSTLPFDKQGRVEQWSLLKSFKPSRVYGSPSLLYLLAKIAKDKGDRDMRFRTFYAWFEPVLSNQRKIIEEVFGCRIYSYYSMEESSIQAFGCEMQQYHPEWETCIMEIVDGQGKQLLNGRQGELIGTNLYNYAMPLIRYQTGDAGVFSSYRCPCGRGGRNFEFIGRSNDVLRCADKTVFSATLSFMLQGLEGIDECQFQQIDENHIRAYVVKTAKAIASETENALVHKLRTKISKDLQVDVVFVKELQKGHTGKSKFILPDAINEYAAKRH